MTVNLVLGCQWGDEGKGKIVDLLCENADIVARFQGGNNAGHTIYKSNKKIVLHLLPSGILNPKTISVIAGGMVVDPIALCKELDNLDKDWSNIYDRLKISGNAHLVTFYHKLIDIFSEDYNKNVKIGSTKRGIGPCYSDKINRCGFRFSNIFSSKNIKEKFKENYQQKKLLLKHFDLNYKPVKFKTKWEEFYNSWIRLKPFIIDSQEFLYNSYKSGKNILLEGAQGTFLDIDHGSYPFVTSSNTTSGGAITGTGLPLQSINRVIAVAKCYTTRVGNGQFISELLGEEAEKLRKAGDEIGATTGRPRRCGWLDLVQIKKAIEINGVTDLILTKLDILDKFNTIKICTKYLKKNIKGKVKVTPKYMQFEGWQTSTLGKTDLDDLPKQAKNYINFISDFLKIKISIISTGPGRDQIIYL